MRPSSRVRIRASRLNGALSRGPVTEAGERRSAANAIYHGLYSKPVVLPNESQKAFDSLIKQYVDELQPQDSHELALVRDMAVTRWRLRRFDRLDQQILDVNLPPKRYVWTEIPPQSSDSDDLTIDTGAANHRFRQQNLYHRSLARLLAVRKPKKNELPNGKNKNVATGPS